MQTYNKLIRDKIPQIIKNTGKNYEVEVMDDQEYNLYLKNKLIEEANEYIESEEIEELADILEVLYAIMDLQGVSKEEVEEIRKKKAKERGGFEKRLKLLGVY